MTNQFVETADAPQCYHCGEKSVMVLSACTPAMLADDWHLDPRYYCPHCKRKQKDLLSTADHEVWKNGIPT